MTRLRRNNGETFAVKTVVAEGGWRWLWWAEERVYAGYSPDPDVYPEVMHRQVVATETSDGHKCCAPQTRTDFEIGSPPPKSEIAQVCTSVEIRNKNQLQYGQRPTSIMLPHQHMCVCA